MTAAAWQLPRIGRVHTHESTRKLARRLEAGTARILRATVACDSSGRWHCSFTVAVRRAVERGNRRRHACVGVDVGVRDLLVAADADGRQVLRVAAARSLSAAQAKLARLQRKAARQTKGSNRRARTLRAVARVHARAANIRGDAIDKATTTLAKTADVVVVADLNVAGMGSRKRGVGARGRGMNRALADAALAEVRRQLGYNTAWYASRLVVADRWFPSSKTCSRCGRRKPSLRLDERTYRCAQPDCGLVADRDRNAAVNLARWPDQAGLPSPGSGPVEVNSGQRADRDTDPAQAGDAGGDDLSTPHAAHAADQTGTATEQSEAA